MKNFDKIEILLQAIKRKRKKTDLKYSVPGLWIGSSEKKVEIRPEEYLLERFAKIKHLAEFNKIPSYKNTEDARVYNVFARLATSFDHDNDGKINLEPIAGEWRETGTFLKSIGLLPYLHSLGINTVYFLPITSIGIDGKKGSLGSPYAIRNPYKLDENLAEPIIEATIEEQFAAFVEAAHELGMKVITEFVFRTGSIDSDLAIEHPDWFYWIKAKIRDRGNSNNEKQYGPPVFTKEELDKIKQKVEKGELTNLPKPHKEHRDMFVPTPKKVARVENKVLGVNNSPRGQNLLESFRIPGAFADWPPNDSQPVWNDVTYLKMYDHKDFNFIAYNTVRMYDTKLAKEENEVKDLWEFIENIIPFYQNEFGIDGVMIDMGHALPLKLRKALVEKAKENKENFTFWEENFSISDASVKEGYNAVLGYMPFDAHDPWKMRGLINWLSQGTCPVPFFATPETHNTKRAASREGGVEFSKIAYLVSSFLTTMTFIHNGFELGEENPVNTGLGFSEEDYEKYPPEKLALFSETELNWKNQDNLVEFIKKVNNIRNTYLKDENKISSKSIQNISNSDDRCLTFVRRSNSNQMEILIGANLTNQEINLEISMLDGVKEIKDEFTGNIIHISDGMAKVSLEPFAYICGKLEME